MRVSSAFFHCHITLELWASSPEYNRYFTAVSESSGHCNTSSHVILWLLVAFWSTMAAPGCESAWHSAQLPSCWVFLLAAQAQEGFAFHLIVMFIHFVPRVTHSNIPSWHVIPLNHLPLKLQGILCNLSASELRVQMTTATPSPPPAVNSLLLDPDNHLPSVAQRCNALPHGLITTTLFHL